MATQSHALEEKQLVAVKFQQSVRNTIFFFLLAGAAMLIGHGNFIGSIAVWGMFVLAVFDGLHSLVMVVVPTCILLVGAAFGKSIPTHLGWMMAGTLIHIIEFMVFAGLVYWSNRVLGVISWL